MTDDMEERLRNALRDRAGVPVAAGDPVASVQARMRRRSHRRGLAVASTAALCVAGIAIAATAFAGNDTSSRPIGPAVSSSSSATPPVTSSARPPTTSPPTSPAASSPAASSPPSSTASAVVAPSSSPPSETLPPNVSALALPTAYTFFGLTTDSGPLLLTGAVASTDPDAPCVRTPINAATLSLGTFTTISCDDPASSGDLVAVTVSNPDAGSNDFASGIAVTRIDPATGTLSTGPTLMRFNDSSNTHVATAYGGGSLWIYAVDTSAGAQAIEVSATSGQVLDVVTTPLLVRPIMIANSSGLWLGNSVDGVLGRNVAGTLFHIAPRSHAVKTVLSSIDVVDWLVADNAHAWAGIRSVGSSLLSLWRFDGPNAAVAFHVTEPSLQELGANAVVGNEQDGLWVTTPDPPIGDTPSPPAHQYLDVVRLDPNTGKARVEAVLPATFNLATDGSTAAGQAAFSQGSYFLLQSPSVGGYTGFTQLLRVTPLP
jgi:hypothetical protein